MRGRTSLSAFFVSTLLACELLAPSALALPPDTPPPLPTRWAEYVKLQRYNDPKFDSLEREPESSFDPVPVYSFLIPEASADVVRSEFLSDATASQFFLEKNGKRYVRFLVIDYDGTVSPEIFRKRFGEPTQDYWAVRMRSHSTFLAWDPKDPNSDHAFFLKVQRDMEEHTHNDEQGRAIFTMGTHNDYDNGNSAVRINDFVGLSLTQSPPREIDYLSEPLAIGVKAGRKHYAVSLRMAEPLLKPFQPGEIPLPLHALTDPKLFENHPEYKILRNTKDWLQTLILKVVQAVAILNFDHGIYPVAHSQNIFFTLMPDGSLGRIMFRDANDVMVDLETRFRKGRPLNTKSIAGWGVSESNKFHVAENESYPVRHPGFNVGNYLFQSIILGFESVMSKKEFEHLFYTSIRAYVRTAERAAGPRPLNFEKKTLSWLHSKFRILEENNGIINEYNTGSSVGYMLQFLYEEIYQAYSKPVVKAETRFDQTLLKQNFFRLNGNHKVVYPTWITKERLHRKARARLSYAFDGERIMAFDPETNQVLAWAYGLSPKKKREIEATSWLPDCNNVLIAKVKTVARG